ncbi:hypothetical protein [Peptoclostridium acidaminophilum]|nr:hypothetical protein [Peptoclostridium acidaminophilum]
MKRLWTKLVGYYRYYGVTDNTRAIRNFKDEVRRLLYKRLNRRSQKDSFNWYKYALFLKKFPLPAPRIYVSIYELRSHISYIM